MAKKKKQDPDNLLEFEKSFDELQQIVHQLEEGHLTLGQSLAQYELGIKRLRECYLALDQAEQRIKILVNLDENGHLITTDFKSETLHSNSTPKSGETTSIDDDSDDGNMDGDRSLF
jgi:exodeoxyribonuclease VII small subunit